MRSRWKYWLGHPALLIPLAVVCLVAFSTYYNTTNNAAVAADETEEWKVWQQRYNEQMAEKQPHKRSFWLTKKLEVKESIIDDEKLPHKAKRGKVVERCLTCHDGIEQFSAFHPTDTYGCTLCHGGKGESLNKEEAHETMIASRSSKGKRNPSNLRIVQKTCGTAGCHAGNEQWDRNHVHRVRMTIMGLQSGILSALRFQYAAQESKLASFSGVGVVDDDYVPAHRGAQKKLDTVPVMSAKDLPTDKEGNPITVDDMGNPMKISGENADSQWRKSCARCHFWNEGKQAPADYRAQGCAACHYLYDNDGLYKGDDPTIPKDEPGHGKLHQISTAIPATQCIHCHNRGGRTGVSYEGRVESDFYGTPFMEGKHSDQKFHGKYYNTPMMDIHYEKGMECIDCHTQFDTMGDGNLYSKKHEQFETRCQDCHGTYKEGIKTTKVTDPKDRVVRLGSVSPNYENKVGDEMVVSGRGNKYTNVKVIDGEVILISKFDGREHLSSVITGKKGIHSIPQHQERMECWTCHARHTSQCYGCHDYYNQTGKGKDKLTGKKSYGKWPEFRSFVRYEEPPLGIGAKGLVTTYIPGCQVQFTAISNDGKIMGDWDNYHFQSAEGYSSMSINPIFTHTIRTEVRTCEDCHLNPKTLGLGFGKLSIDPDPSGKKDRMKFTYETGRSGVNLGFPLEVMVTPQGNQVASTSHIGSRPFNQAEINRILKVGNCLACHDGYDDPIFQDIYKAYVDFSTKCQKDNYVKEALKEAAVKQKKPDNVGIKTALRPRSREEVKP